MEEGNQTAYFVDANKRKQIGDHNATVFVQSDWKPSILSVSTT